VEPDWAEPGFAGLEDCVELPLGEGGVAWVSPPTGVVPGAGWVAGVLDGVLFVDCAKTPADSARAKPASAHVLEPFNSALMTNLQSRRVPTLT
jgi:hypothetical protein